MVRWLNPDCLPQLVRALVSPPTPLLGPHIPFLRAELGIGRDRVPSPATSEDRGSRLVGVRAARCGRVMVMARGLEGQVGARTWILCREMMVRPLPQSLLHLFIGTIIRRCLSARGEASRRLSAIVYDEDRLPEMARRQGRTAMGRWKGSD
ncbi:hypothetical protein B0H16DRAFT_1623675 [Mycena metata]|uniref:Uncharacterized protein n=1 Tax=Mycena metata TaxID=1033252 RepID=A0AAD7ME10_9AGAR|nr:hypothetical protein B0H16DRAFT_1623675 [Mycena metata]